MAQTPDDPLFAYQWGLLNTGQYDGSVAGVDIDVLPVWAEYTGAGVRVAVADTGFQLDQPDLIANTDASSGWDAVNDTAGGSPQTPSDNHGTAVAGIIGAAMNNGIGGVGVAPGATLVSYRVLGNASDDGRDSDATSAATTIAFNKALQDNIDVINNSWGPTGSVGPNSKTIFDENWTGGQSQEGSAIAALATNGRNGKGTVIVFSNGNARAYDDDADLNNNTNSRYTIAVAAIDSNGVVSSYSSAGANLLISAPGSEGGSTTSPAGGIVTTDRTSSDGYNKTAGTAGDTDYGFNGTSAAAPFISGVTALMLQADPTLGYRDVQQILAYTARQTDPGNSSWTTTNALTANGGGLNFSRDYGFGLVDAYAAVRVAESYGVLTQYELSGFSKTEANVTIQSATDSPATPTVIAAGGQAVFRFGYTSTINVEHVDLLLGLNAPDTSALTVTLTSPSGTSIDLVKQTPGVSTESEDVAWPGTFRLGSFGFMGEASSILRSGQIVGNWTLTIKNAGTTNINYTSADLQISGSDTATRSFIYTDSYTAQVASDPSRAYAIISSSATPVIMNASAVTGNVSADIPNNIFTIDGVRTYISGSDTPPGPSFTPNLQAFMSGDGNDTLVGGTGQLLDAGRGNNTVVLGGSTGIVNSIGNDTITALQGVATVSASGQALVFGNNAALDFIGQGGASTVVGGAGAMTVSGGAGQVTVYGSTGGGDSIVGGAAGGNQLAANGSGSTLFSQGAGNALYGSNDGTSTLVTQGSANTVFGGTGGGAVITNGSHDLVILDEGASTLFGGNDAAIFTNGANADIVGDTGSMAIGFGSGASTAWASSGTDLFLFANGEAGGTVTLNNFQAGKDFIQLSGYGTDAVQDALTSAVQTAAGLSLTLSDQTSITLTGITALNQSSFIA